MEPPDPTSKQTTALSSMVEKYRETCTVPQHPKVCPECGSKVSTYHLNFDEAAWMCSSNDVSIKAIKNDNEVINVSLFVFQCVWPLASLKPTEIFGKSDVSLLMKIKSGKKKQKKLDKSNSSLTSAEDETASTKSSHKEVDRKENFDDFVNDKPVPVEDNGNSHKSQVEVRINDGEPVDMDNLDDDYPPPPALEASDQESDDEEDSFHRSFYNVPNPMSPMSPSHSLLEGDDDRLPGRAGGLTPRGAGSATTPSRSERVAEGGDVDDQGFVRPASSMLSTPVRQSTPFHVPALLSPMPATPYRSRDSERSVGGNLDYDLNLTDSEVSDVERTPQHVPEAAGRDMPSLMSPLRPSLQQQCDGAEPSPPSMKMVLKRNKDKDRWDVEGQHKEQPVAAPDPDPDPEPDDWEDVVLPDRPAVSGKQPFKLDKVVLNLKKSAGSGNSWNITEKKSSQSDLDTTMDASGEPTATATATTEAPPKEERRGRKSKSVPMKIQNMDSIDMDATTTTSTTAPEAVSSPNNSSATATEKVDEGSGKPPEDDIALPDQPQIDQEQQVTTATTTIATVPLTATASVTSPTSSISNKMASPAKTRPPIKTFSRVKKAKTIETSLSNRLAMSTGMAGVSVDIMDPALKSKTARPSDAFAADIDSQMNWREVAELASKAASEVNNVSKNRDFQEVSELLKFGTSIQDKRSFIQRIQKSLKLDNTSKNGEVTFFVGQNKSSIDLPLEESSLAVSDENAKVKVMLSSESDGIEGEVLKTKAVHTTLPVEQKKRGRPAKPRPELADQPNLRPISPPPTLVPQPQTAVPHDLARPSRYSGPAVSHQQAQFQRHQHLYMMDNNLQQQQYHHNHHQQQNQQFPQQQPPPGSGFDEILADPVKIRKFREHLNILMQEYQMPNEFAVCGIDPVVAMMVTRAADPAFASINFEAMLQLYAKLQHYDRLLQQQQQQNQHMLPLPNNLLLQHQQQQQQHHQAQVGFNPQQQRQTVQPQPQRSSQQHFASGSYQEVPQFANQSQQHQGQPVNRRQQVQQQQPAMANRDRVYAELQTVRRSEEVTDATQVLRRHQEGQQVQEAEEASSTPTGSGSSKTASAPSPDPRTSGPETSTKSPPAGKEQSSRMIIKQEVMTPLAPGALNNDPGSVNVTSVYAPPASVSVITGHSKEGGVGTGDKVVTFKYSNGYFGPIRVETEEEVKAVVALVEDKIQEREYRDQHGGRFSQGVVSTTEAIRARSLLSQQIIKYIDKAFTKKGLKENVVGRKKRNYPKRSQIIKTDPETGKLRYPEKHPLSKESGLAFIKTEQPSEIDEAHPGAPGPGLLPLPPSLANHDKDPTSYNPPTPVLNASIDEIIQNSQNVEANNSSRPQGDPEPDPDLAPQKPRKIHLTKPGPLIAGGRVQDRPTLAPDPPPISVPAIPICDKTAPPKDKKTPEKKKKSGESPVKISLALFRSKDKNAEKLESDDAVEQEDDDDNSDSNARRSSRIASKKERKRKVKKDEQAEPLPKMGVIEVTPVELVPQPPLQDCSDSIPDQAEDNQELEESGSVEPKSSEVGEETSQDSSENLRPAEFKKMTFKNVADDILSASLIPQLPNEEDSAAIPSTSGSTTTETSLKSKSEAAKTMSTVPRPGYMNTRRISQLMEEQAIKSKKSFNPQSLLAGAGTGEGGNTSASTSNIFIRKNQQARIKKLLDRKKKKEEKHEMRKLKAMQKKANVYVGMGEPKDSDDPAAKARKKFRKTPATIDGKKLVLTSTNEIVQVQQEETPIPVPESPAVIQDANIEAVPDHPHQGVQKQPPPPSSGITQKERDLIDELIRVAGEELHDPVPTPAQNQQPAASSQELMDFEMASSLHPHAMEPSFDDIF